MKQYNITVNGNTYEVLVEEVGGVASAPVAPVFSAPVAMPAASATPAAPKAAAPTTAPKTADPITLAALSAALTGAALVVSKKRK